MANKEEMILSVSARNDNGDMVLTEETPSGMRFSYCEEEAFIKAFKKMFKMAIKDSCNDGFETFKGKIKLTIEVIDE